MRRTIVLASFAALCATASAAGAMPIAKADAAIERITPVTYYGYGHGWGYRHGFRHYYKPYGYYPHYYGYYHYGHPYWRHYWH